MAAYITIAEVRAEGLASTSTWPDATITAAIDLWQSVLCRICRQWFHDESLTLQVDGNDSDTLHFGVPIISVSELRINDQSVALDPSYYRAYAGNQKYPDNDRNPRISLIDSLTSHNDIYTAPMSNGLLRFRKGFKNQYIVGHFGYLEGGVTPPAIKRALLKLVVRKLTQPIYSNPAIPPPPILTGIVTEEWTDGHRVKYGQLGGSSNPKAPGLSGMIDDPEILDILKLYKAPIGVATAAGPSYK